MENDGQKIDVFVIKPESASPLPAYIFARPGGGCLHDAVSFQGYMVEHALDNNCITFNVDFRNAPKTKCPGGVMDYYKTIKYVVANADSLGVDSTRIVIAGMSGGGMICMGAAYELAKNDEEKLVKQMWLHCPMLSHGLGSVPYDSLNSYEKLGFCDIRNFYQMLATDLDNQQGDPQLYPGRMPANMLRKLPPTIIWTSEFDFLYRDTQALIKKMEEEKAPLLDYFSMSGAEHGYEFLGGEQAEVKNKAVIKAWKHYVVEAKEP